MGLNRGGPVASVLLASLSCGSHKITRLNALFVPTNNNNNNEESVGLMNSIFIYVSVLCLLCKHTAQRGLKSSAEEKMNSW